MVQLCKLIMGDSPAHEALVVMMISIRDAAISILEELVTAIDSRPHAFCHASYSFGFSI
jgi:hypothetical protein